MLSKINSPKFDSSNVISDLQNCILHHLTLNCTRGVELSVEIGEFDPDIYLSITENIRKN